MAEAVAVVGLAAAIVQLLDFGDTVIQRVVDYQKKGQWRVKSLQRLRGKSSFDPERSQANQYSCQEWHPELRNQ